MEPLWSKGVLHASCSHGLDIRMAHSPQYPNWVYEFSTYDSSAWGPSHPAREEAEHGAVSVCFHLHALPTDPED